MLKMMFPTRNEFDHSFDMKQSNKGIHSIVNKKILICSYQIGGDIISLSMCKINKTRIKQPRDINTLSTKETIVFPYHTTFYTFPTQVSEEQSNSLPHQHSLCLTNGQERKFASSLLGNRGGTREQTVRHAEEIQKSASRVSSDNFHYTRLYGPQRGAQVQNAATNATQRDVRLSKPPKYPEYVSDSRRLMSFWNWIEPGKPDKHHLTTVGFFFTGTNDLVRCFQCGIGLKDFDADDEPLLEHIKHSPECTFLLELLGEEQLEVHKNNLRRNVPEFCRQRQLDDLHHQQGEENFIGNIVGDTVSSQPIVYRHPNYATFNARVSSYSKFPRSVHQTPQALAAAGLFYTGFQDLVRCCACDGGLKMWRPDDDPWFEHCLWFPACPFVGLIKGPAYIAEVQATAEKQKQTQVSEKDIPAYENEVAGAVSKLTITEDRKNIKDKSEEIDDIKSALTEMGFKDYNIIKAVEGLKAKGKGLKDMSAEEVIDQIYVDESESTGISKPSERINKQKSRKGELLTENARLKSITKCADCENNEVSVLFLPCQHHRLCFDCGTKYEFCPHCRKQVKQKIRTYMS